MESEAAAGPVPAPPPAPGPTTDLREVLRAQRRRRLVRFWVGFVAILIVGGLWAGLTKDPVGPGRFGEAGFDEPAFEVVEAEAEVEEAPVPVPTTAIEPAPTPATETTTTVGP